MESSHLLRFASSRDVHSLRSSMLYQYTIVDSSIKPQTVPSVPRKEKGMVGLDPDVIHGCPHRNMLPSVLEPKCPRRTFNGQLHPAAPGAAVPPGPSLHRNLEEEMLGLLRYIRNANMHVLWRYCTSRPTTIITYIPRLASFRNTRIQRSARPPLSLC